jgi:excisionase family DNA binding protein
VAHTNITPDTRLLYKVARAAELLDMSRAQLYKMIQEGTVRAVRVGHSVRIPAEVVEALAEKGTAQ